MSTYRGQKSYELSNHLGNILAVVSDRVNTETTDGVTVDGFEADVQSANDYYPFGMQMPDRNMSSDQYRYGFNGMEKDDDLAGGKKGMSYDFGARLYNPGLGKFISVDPWADKYAWQSSFAYFSNSPISKLDYKGLGDEDDATANTDSDNTENADNTTASTSSGSEFGGNAETGANVASAFQTTTTKAQELSIVKGGVNNYSGAIRPGSNGLDITFKVTNLKPGDKINIIQIAITTNDDKFTVKDAQDNNVLLSSDKQTWSFIDNKGFYYSDQQQDSPKFSSRKTETDGSISGELRHVDGIGQANHSNSYTKIIFTSYVVVRHADGTEAVLGRVEFAFTRNKDGTSSPTKTGTPTLKLGGYTAGDKKIINYFKK